MPGLLEIQVQKMALQSTFSGFYLPLQGAWFHPVPDTHKNSKSISSDTVPVRVRPPAPLRNRILMRFFCLPRINRKKDFILFYLHPSQHPS
jgi:hypothetical protein